ncbi:hypothetical protein HBA55_35035 [Pseudomaricurvus alkylphenolicus]|uniref:hypothetical protein n=1 Tax=Pseudomaricurvus alkylphenolicus TaxID=1306991 RepID=UPI0014248752|nr:hypothetical protein [Pseudomaricurvus alkylphenolicus]NIB44849.1 hypothetical protein [Pseudomaricurvus alkylphenolicus]
MDPVAVFLMVGFMAFVAVALWIWSIILGGRLEDANLEISHLKKQNNELWEVYDHDCWCKGLEFRPEAETK